METLPRLKSIRVLNGYKVAFTLQNAEGERVADLTPIITRHRFFVRQRDFEEFKQVYICDWGGGIAWGPEDAPDRPDLSADSLVRLSEGRHRFQQEE